MKEIVILGGPNGAGKTTAARKLMPKFSHVREFLNADEFARAISPDDVESAAFAAGRRMLARMQELFRIEPRAVAYDLHPNYLSTKLALELTGLEKIGVQHHHGSAAGVVQPGGQGRLVAEVSR